MGERSYCAGADIKYVVNIDPIEAERCATFIHCLLNKIENLEKPVIAAINGYALGGDCELALECDITNNSIKQCKDRPELQSVLHQDGEGLKDSLELSVQQKQKSSSIPEK
jgi:3-hydroxypropionyl-coenzyme A dehydratase